MEDKIKNFVENTKELKSYINLPKEELQLMRTYINLDLVWFIKEKEQQPKFRIVNSCLNYKYNFLTSILNCKYNVDRMAVTKEYIFKEGKEYDVCTNCQLKSCIKQMLPNFMNIVDYYNTKNDEEILYIDVIDCILKRKSPNFKSIPEEKFFDNVNIVDLMFVHAVLEADLINLTIYNEKTGEISADYLDLTVKKDDDYFINDLLYFYRNGKGASEISINIKRKDEIFKEKDFYSRIYKIVAYYKYLIEIERVDIIATLRKMLDIKNLKSGISIRAHYYIYRYFEMVKELPCSQKAKEKIIEIFNYILNYRYKKNVPYIPINMVIYSEDKDIVEMIVNTVSAFMWFFGYLPDDMHVYNGFIDKILLDKYQIKELYYENKKSIHGILLLHDFQNLLYVDNSQKELILNILSIEIERHNKNVCTVIYGNKEEINQILGNHPKLSRNLINIELYVDNMDEEKVYDIIKRDLAEREELTEKVKEKLHDYIQSSYKQSEIKDMQYITKLYNSIILEQNKQFDMENDSKLKLENIPEPLSTKDIASTLEELNSLIGLEEIKSQINDLVYLLKFNKKAKIDISNFNLHMFFTGNPGTGKTTVARMITNILYSLEYVPQNRLTEIVAKDLIADYLGQTAGKTYKAVKSAIGGVLFIDEAYSITSGDGDGTQYGNEAIATLIKMMEDYKDKLVIIFAGYKDEMEKFEKANPGMASRIGYKIDFPDYTLEELTKIFLNLLQKNNLKITKTALDEVKGTIQESLKVENFGNARYINNMFQKILIEHAKNQEQNNYMGNLYQINKKDIKYEKLVAKNTKRKIGF